MKERRIKYGDGEIVYILTRKKVKNINLNVKADGKISVSADPSISIEMIEKFIIRKSRWLARHLSVFEVAKELFSPPKEYVSGENYNYLGKQYRLKVSQSNNEQVEIDGGFLKLYVKDKDNLERKKSLINKWFKDQIQIVLGKVFKKMREKFSTIFNDSCDLRIRAMKTRWGTCNAKKLLITLNSNLIFAPEYCIEYVVLHELCHFKFQNHCKGFFELLENLMPDWEARKKILDEEIARHIVA
ncbi:MAG: M48 family metallopeptidase [Firmicutes bacterium]|nr:M48 family metallopeptidase [Bacillota bacterium]